MAAGDTVITLIGNLVDDPELRFTPNGQAVAKFRHRPPTGTDERGARIQHRRARFSPPR